MTPSFAVFNAFLEWESQRAMRYQEAFALALISLDRATTNDRGQNERAMLGIVAENVRKAVRQTDLVAQTAGTVCVLLLYVDRGGAMQIAERVRAQIEAFRFPGRSLPERLSRSVSIGVACFPLDAVDIAELQEQALGCLRGAQEVGGNRVLLFNGG